MSQQANNRAWSTPMEVGAAEMGNRSVVLDEAKYAFYLDICLRLEQTKPGKAVRYDFAEAKTAKAYQRYVSRRMRDGSGKGWIRSCLRTSPDGLARVYFARGPKYDKDGRMSAADERFGKVSHSA